MKVLCLGVNDRGLRFFKMKYMPQSVPQYCELKKRGERPFKVLVSPQHLFYLQRPLFPLPPLSLIKRVVPCFIFNMLNRQSLRLVEDLTIKAKAKEANEGEDETEVSETDPGSFWFLGRSVDVHDKEEEIDPKAANVLDFMTQPSFWQGLRRQMDMPRSTMIIIAVAGVGAWEVIRNMISIFV